MEIEPIFSQQKIDATRVDGDEFIATSDDFVLTLIICSSYVLVFLVFGGYWGVDETFLFLPRKFLDVPQIGRDHCFGSVCMGSISVWIRPFLTWLGEIFVCATEHYCFFLKGSIVLLISALHV